MAADSLESIILKRKGGKRGTCSPFPFSLAFEALCLAIRKEKGKRGSKLPLPSPFRYALRSIDSNRLRFEAKQKPMGAHGHLEVDFDSESISERIEAARRSLDIERDESKKNVINRSG